MTHPDQLNEQDAEDVLRTIAGVCNGLPIGKFRELIRESVKRSRFTEPQIVFALGLIALHWGRVKLQCFEFEFSDRLHVDIPESDSASEIELEEFGFYVRLKQKSQTLERKWLNVIAITYGTEYNAIKKSMPTTVNFHCPDPIIVIDPGP